MMPKLTYWVEGNSCCNQRWEDAYNRFETETEEIQKFQKRLNFLGARNWNPDAKIVDLFCGSGRNLVCLERMGFKNLHGVDLSPRLLSRYSGKAELYVGDATELTFPDSWADIVIIQGGLHHLPNLPNDLEKCTSEIHRILRPNGLFIMVEPWLTSFLAFVHWCCDMKSLKRISSKIDALSIMIYEEKITYFSWLYKADEITKILDSRFNNISTAKKWGKIMRISSPIK